MIQPIPTPSTRLDRTNFLIWKTLILPGILATNLHGYMDGFVAAPPKTITKGTSDDAVQQTNQTTMHGGCRINAS